MENHRKDLSTFGEGTAKRNPSIGQESSVFLFTGTHSKRLGTPKHH